MYILKQKKSRQLLHLSSVLEGDASQKASSSGNAVHINLRRKVFPPVLLQKLSGLFCSLLWSLYIFTGNYERKREKLKPRQLPMNPTSGVQN